MDNFSNFNAKTLFLKKKRNKAFNYFQSGLKVGDMILAINTETFIGISYDEVGFKGTVS